MGMRTADVDTREAERLAADGTVLLLDVREPDEWAAGHAPGAVHVPLAELDPATLPGDRPIVAVCRSGNRSGTAAARIGAAGLRVRNMAGGMNAWAEAGQPVVRDDGSTGVIG
jgi:rhodanese-related sulfurtransferase